MDKRKLSDEIIQSSITGSQLNREDRDVSLLMNNSVSEGMSMILFVFLNVSFSQILQV